MGCCDLKTLSLIVAWLQTICPVIGVIMFIVILVGVHTDEAQKSEYYEQYGDILVALLVIGIICGLLAIALGVTLIVGISQERHRLMAIYVYLSYGAIVLGAIGLVLGFVMGLVNKQPFGNVFLGLIRNAFGLGIQILFFAPIYLFYKKLRAGPLQPEQYRLGNNEPLHKPQYAHGGKV